MKIEGYIYIYIYIHQYLKSQCLLQAKYKVSLVFDKEGKRNKIKNLKFSY